MKRLLAVALVVMPAGFSARLCPPPLPPPPTAERLTALRAERDALQKRVSDAAVGRGEKSLAQAPRAGLMIGVPTAFTASILDQVVTGLFGETTLTLRNLKVHKEGEVKAKMLLRKKRLGTFVLDVTIHEVQGLLRPGKPKLTFGSDRIDLALPVELASGQGHADLRFKWDSKGFAANTVCGDVDVTKAVTGGVIPEEYTVIGNFGVQAKGSAIVLTPRFPDLAVKIYVDPSEQAWAVVDEVIKEQRAGCEIALTKVDVKQRIGDILGRGFNVKVPQKIFKPVGLPAGVSQSLEVQGIQLALDVKPTGLLVAGDRMWYGADIDLAQRPKGAAPAKPKPKASPAPKASKPKASPPAASPKPAPRP